MKENAFIINILTMKEVIKTESYLYTFLLIPNLYKEPKLMRTHVKNPLIYPNNPFNINKTTEQQVDLKTVYLNHFGNSV